MAEGRERAILFTGRERAELESVEAQPGPPGPREVLGRTLATLVSAGTELARYRSDGPPAMVGYAAVFRVEAVGGEVSRLRPGDLALCLGPHRSYQRVVEDEALRVPEGLKPEEATFARLMGVTLSTLVTTTARPPDRVLVSGLGPVGHLGARIFHACGYEVAACDPFEPRRALLRDRGPRTVLPQPPLEDEEWRGRVSLALECSGHESAVLDACRMVRKRGEVVLVGVPWQRRTDATAHELLDLVFHNYVVLRSGWEWEVSRHPEEFRVGSIHGNLTAALRWLAEGRLGVDGLYAAARPEDAQQVYQDLLHQRWPALAAVFQW